MKIAVLGANGLVGDALARNLEADIFKLKKEKMDVLNTDMLRDYLKSERFELVINCAAYVGGIELNRKKQYTMFSKNIEINQSVINACIASDIGKLVLFCSNCVYPVKAIQPYNENDIFNGDAIETNQGYAAAKIAGIQAGRAAHQEYGIDVYHPIPCSLFGYRDNYKREKSHFIAAAISKIYGAVERGDREIKFWGTGKPCRELLFADELASALSKILEKGMANEPINIGTGEETPIREVIEILSEIAGYNGDITWDNSKPDGAMHKLLDNSKMKQLNWKPKLSLRETLKKTYKYFERGENIRK